MSIVNIVPARFLQGIHSVFEYFLLLLSAGGIVLVAAHCANEFPTSPTVPLPSVTILNTAIEFYPGDTIKVIANVPDRSFGEKDVRFWWRLLTTAKGVLLNPGSASASLIPQSAEIFGVECGQSKSGLFQRPQLWNRALPCLGCAAFAHN